MINAEGFEKVAMIVLRNEQEIRQAITDGEIPPEWIGDLLDRLNTEIEIVIPRMVES